MAYSAYCDTASATKWYITGTGSAVNRLSEVMDDNASGVEEADNPGNYQPWTTFMTEVVEDAIYIIHLPFDVGDDVVSTTLVSKNEIVYLDTGVVFTIGESATLELGALSNGFGVEGSYWSVALGANKIVMAAVDTNAVFNCYASKFHNRGLHYISWQGGSVDIRNSIFSGIQHIGATSNTNIFYGFKGLASLNMLDVYFHNIYSLYLESAGGTFEDIHIHKARRAIQGTDYYVTATVTDLTVTDSSYDLIRLPPAGGWTKLALVNPNFAITASDIEILNAGSVVYEQYTCNIHVADKDGANLAGVTIDCVGSDSGTASTEYDTAQWTAGSEVTDASGDLDEQTITAKKWTGTSETLTNYNYFKFTLSKAGYETMVLENVTVDAPVVWHLELQPLGGAGAQVKHIGIGVNI